MTAIRIQQSAHHTPPHLSYLRSLAQAPYPRSFSHFPQRSNWTFEFPIEGVFKFHELYQEMTIEIYVTSLASQQPLPATTVEQLVQKQQSDDRNRIPCLLDKYVTPHSVPSRDADGRWVRPSHTYIHT